MDGKAAIIRVLENLLEKIKEGKATPKLATYDREIREYVDHNGVVVKFPSNTSSLKITYEEEEE